MHVTTKDAVGVILVVGTAAALLVHNAPSSHRDSHRRPVLDAGGAVTSAEESATIAFYDVNVVPMDRQRVLRHQVVIVQGNFISKIADVGVAEVPSQARRIEGHGTLYLAPGLTDAHVHLGETPEALLPLYLANGVTSVFNLEGSERHLALRDRVLAGEALGPTIYTAGPFVDETLVRSPRDARRIVGEQHDRGYDFVKLHGDLSLETYRALTGAGASEGIAVLGHAPRNLPLSAVLEGGQADLSHAEELIYTEFMSLDPSSLAPVAERVADAGIWLTPSISTFSNIVSQWGAPEGLAAALARPGADFISPALRHDWESTRDFLEQDPAGRERLQRMLDFHAPLVRAFHDAGVPLLTGTDAGLLGMVPGFSIHDELTALRASGLTAYEVLQAATANAGRFVQEHVDPAASFGVVVAGSRADLVLLDGDPTGDLGVLRRPLGVMVRGRWFDRSALDRMLSSAATDR